ncbi:hypothetical protein C1H46_022788 [Malus baccata]|uniref:Uncharacterized protein n=1 Tax=Malus baccata TaxID=106549 RepID=A0A540LYM8_MALBA|nr:hypothetical protein C1H46_022788 [Malus baccata]
MIEILLDHHPRTDSDDSHRQIDRPRCNIKALLRINGICEASWFDMKTKSEIVHLKVRHYCLRNMSALPFFKDNDESWPAETSFSKISCKKNVIFLEGKSL